MFLLRNSENSFIVENLILSSKKESNLLSSRKEDKKDKKGVFIAQRHKEKKMCCGN